MRDISAELRLTLAVVVMLARVSFAQARVVSAPPEPSLLTLTGGWSRASLLGDLREVRAGNDYLEVRAWKGFDLTSTTEAVVLRRLGGQWSAFLARVIRCEIMIARSVEDTASRATMQGYVAEARRQCGKALPSVGPGARIVAADTLIVERLSVPDTSIENAWSAAMSAGLFQLPPRIDRKENVSDAPIYVVEVRRGNTYRASQIEHVENSENESDRRLKDALAAVRRVLTANKKETANRNNEPRLRTETANQTTNRNGEGVTTNRNGE